MPTPHEQVLKLLNDGHAAYRIVEHEPEGRSEIIAKIRGNRPEQSLKAIVVSLRGGGGEGKRYAMAIVPGNRRVDMRSLKKELGAQKGSFVDAQTLNDLTGCVMGSVPPFVFNDDLPLIADEDIRDNEEVVFNAGRLDRSIFMSLDDYIALAKPRFAKIAQA
jgi:Ala-tRNA(Pro) deacylase